MTIGERVKFRRQQLGLTQSELAKRLGNSSRASICTVEKDREDLTTTRIAKLAKALETNPSWLMGWTDDISPDFPIPAAIKDNMDVLSKKINTTVYYDFDETVAAAQEIFEDKYMKLLFDAAKDSKPEDIEMAAEMLKRLKGTNDNG